MANKSEQLKYIFFVVKLVQFADIGSLMHGLNYIIPGFDNKEQAFKTNYISVTFCKQNFKYF